MANLTIFQKLGRVLAQDSKSPTYTIDPKTFANLDDKEAAIKKLEAQQTLYLQNQWKKIDNELYQKAVYYEPTRIASYFDYEAMEYSIIGETLIATPQGFISIKELADKGRDYEFITYAYDHNLKKVVPAKARNAHYTRDEMTYKITFDDGKFIVATKGHRFLKRDGVFCELENLKPGDSMMPFYRKSFYNNQNYNWVYICNKNEGHHGWVSEHNLIAEWFYETKIEKDEEVHHVDFNGKNNNPENLTIMKQSEHRAYHARLNNKKLWANAEYRTKMLEIGKRTDNKHHWNGERSGYKNPPYIKLDFSSIVNTAKTERTIEKTAKALGVSYRKIQRDLRFNGFKSWDDFLIFFNIKKYRMISENFELINFKLIPWDLLVTTAKEEKEMLKVCKKLGITMGKLRSTIRQGGYKNWTVFTNAYGITMGKTGRKKEINLINHKIILIEPYGIEPVYDLTVPGYKNFATDSIFSHNTPEIAVALDIFADEATTSSEQGNILTIYSESTRIKNELTDLFENVLDINTNLNSWARNVCKYGDNFVYVKIVPKLGIIGCTQLPNVEITRSDPGFNFVTSHDNFQKERATKFYWKDKNIEFNSFEVAHFRLLGDDRKLPYGTSLLEKVRRIWKQLLLCVAKDTVIATPMGYREIQDIKPGDEIYSYDSIHNKIITTKVKRCLKTGDNREIYKIHTRYSDLEVTDNHPILIHNGLNFIYKTIFEIDQKNDRIVCPTTIDGYTHYEVLLDSSNYYMRLNDDGILHYKNNINKSGIINKIKNEIEAVNYKNIHSFLCGKRRIKSTYFNILNKIFGITNEMVIHSYLNDNENSLINNDFTYCVDKDFGRFFGFMLGDGWLSKNGIGFALGVDDVQNNYYIDYIEKKFGKSFTKTDPISGIRGGKIEIHSKELKNIFKELGFISGYNKKIIPDWIFGMNGEFRLAVIRGLFDANGSDEWGVIGLANKKMITQLKALCQSVGLASGKISKTNGSVKQENGKLVTRKDSYKLYINWNKIDQSQYEKIISIDYYKNDEVWDLEVESNTHNFIANGMVVHNCEDAMLVYRVTRAPERRVYKIYVGNMDDKDIDAYVDKIANNFKRTSMVDISNGQQDTRYNPLAVDQDYFIPVRDPSLNMPIETLPGACIALDTKIPLLDGRVLSLQEIINEWDEGNRNLWVYSCDPKTGSPHPGIITWAGVTRRNTDVMKITLDNGEEVVTTPDHKFVHKTNGFVEAQHLNVGDSLMPFYTQEDYVIKKKYSKTYKQIWDNSKGEWTFVHRVVGHFMKEKNHHEIFNFNGEYLTSEKNVIHHKDNNRYNNNPNNLAFMNPKDHYLYHQYALWSTPEKAEINKGKISKGLKSYINLLTDNEKQIRYSKNINNPVAKLKTTKKLLEWNKDENNLIEKSKKIAEAFSDVRKEKLKELNEINWNNEEYRNKVFSKKQTITFGNEIYNKFITVFETNLRADKTLEILNKDIEFMDLFQSINSDIRSSMTNLNEFTHNHVEKMIKERGFKNFSEWKKNECEKRGYINQRQWKYNVDKEIYFNHKIIKIEWLDEKIDTGTLTIDGNEIYSNSHTFAIQSGIYIKNSNLSEIADIEYIQKKMLAALRVPKAFIGFDEATGEGKNLAILDIRFARAVHRVQKALIQELNKLAIIHLYTKGYEDDLSNFTLELTSPSTQADILKVQNWTEKISLYRDAVSDAGNGYGAVSMTWAKKEILNMSDEDIKLDVQRQAVEKAGSEELKIIGETIKQTGLFREIYKAYKINPDNMSTPQSPNQQKDDNPGGGGGGMGNVGSDFTTPLDNPEGGMPDANGMTPGGEDNNQTNEPNSDSNPTNGEPNEENEPIKNPDDKNNLTEDIKKTMDNKRFFINDTINKTINDINRLLKE